MLKCARWNVHMLECTRWHTHVGIHMFECETLFKYINDALAGFLVDREVGLLVVGWHLPCVAPAGTDE